MVSGFSTPYAFEDHQLEHVPLALRFLKRNRFSIFSCDRPSPVRADLVLNDITDPSRCPLSSSVPRTLHPMRMSPTPTERGADEIKIEFIDAASSLSSTGVLKSGIGYPEFLSFLHDLSGSIAYKLQGLPRQYAVNQGFTLADGLWWYRFAKSNHGDNEAASTNISVCKGHWKLMDSQYVYDVILSELRLGIPWKGGWLEVQHVGSISRSPHHISR